MMGILPLALLALTGSMVSRPRDMDYGNVALHTAQ